MGVGGEGNAKRGDLKGCLGVGTRREPLVGSSKDRVKRRALPVDRDHAKVSFSFVLVRERKVGDGKMENNELGFISV